jgi:hypothetical protein
MRRFLPLVCGLVSFVELLAASPWRLVAQPPAGGLQPPVAQAPHATGEIRVARLIRQLGADSFSTRDQADEALAALGPGARKELEAAIADPDPEVRLRAKDLLARLKLTELWSPGRVSLAGGEQPASKILGAIAAESGNHVLLGDSYGSFHEQPVTLGQVAPTFWEVLDETCRLSGNRVRPHYDTRQAGLVVVTGTPCRFPTAYSGPLRAQIVSARRSFNEELDYENLSSNKAHTFELGLQFIWEDRFRLLAYRSHADLVEARTNTGVELPPTQSTGNGWNVAGAGTRQLTMSLRLQPPPTSAAKLATLKFKWGLIAIGDMATMEVKDLKSAEPHYQDDLELVVESVEQDPESRRYKVNLLVTRELVIPEPQEVLFQENEIELCDAEGRPFRKQAQTNNLTESGAKISLTFLGESPESVPAVLKFTYPRLRAQRDVEIVFRDVPLPVGRPE